MESKKKKTKPRKKANKTDSLKAICWVVIPVTVVCVSIFDCLGIYIFNDMRLIVFGFGILALLVPFFSEISVKDLSIKRAKKSDEN